MAKEKEVKVKITTEVEDSKVKSLEQELEKISSDKHNVDIETNNASSKAKSLKSDVDKVDDEELSVKLDTTNAMVGLQTIKDGFNGLKVSIQEIGQQFSQVMSSAGRYETNLAYLANSMGLDQAKGKMEEINDIVAKLPGDDTAIGGILSSAAARDSSLTKDNLQSIAASAADYMSAMSYYGKTATEAQQDMTNYILTGNTAELERSPILSSHIDKLKQASSIQDRQKVLAEALNEEGWGGMSQADTYNNKLETFNGMLERGRQNLGLMFMAGSKGAMDFLLNLDNATGGMVGLTFAAFGFLQPIGEGLMSIGQMSQGLQALGINGANLKTLWGYLKDVGGAALDAASALLSAGRAALEAGLNALKSAGMWLAEKVQILASTVAKGAAAVASYALALAEWLLASPILLIVIAIVALIAILWYLYNTNESVRAAIDGFAQALWGFGEAIYNGIVGAIQWLIDGLTWLWETITGLFTTTSGEGINWLTTMMMVMMGPIGWILLLIQHWDQIAPAVSNALSGMYNAAVNWFNQTGARIHSFASNFVSTLSNAAWNAVSSFAAGISGIASAIADELDRAWSTVVSWGQQLIQRFWQIAVDAVNALKRGLGIGSPGFMYYMVEGEVNRIDDLAKNTDMPSSFATLGKNMVNEFNPQFGNGADGNGGTGGVVNNFSFTFTGFINDEERLTDLIIKTITDEINWNNATANRTV